MWYALTMKAIKIVLIAIIVTIPVLIIVIGTYNYSSRQNTPPILLESTPVPVVDLIKTRMESMTPEEKVGQMFLVGIYTNDSKVPLTKLITEQKIGSVIIMGPNIKNLKVSDVTSNLQSIASSTHQPPLLISIDQEGGIVSRIKDSDSDLTGQPDIKNTEQAHKVSLARGQELRRKGVNVNFAPILEHISSTSSFLYNRVFRGDASQVSALGAAMVKGYQEAGIAATIKHFPGHDDESSDSHKGLPVSGIDLTKINEHARPFREVIDTAKPEVVMMAHVLFPNIDPDFPATLSPTIIDILRSDYAYSGVIVTDDMNMGAITKNFGVEKSAVQAVVAGNDILLYVATPDTVIKSYNAVIAALKSGKISKERLDASVYRILKLKEKVAGL